MIESVSIFQHWYIAVPCIFVIYKVVDYVRTLYVKRKLGAQSILNKRGDGWFGFKTGRLTVKYQKEGTAVAISQQRFREVDHPEVFTYQDRIFGQTVVITKDPENIKAMLATQFSDFVLGERLKAFGPLLGEGIFTLDHAGWKDSRAMLRPQFAREQVAHVRSLEPHIQYLFKHIDLHKGEYFDIQELFFRFTVDSATEFLFGSSVSSLQDESIGCNTKELDFAGRLQFADSFNKAQVYLAVRTTLSNLYWLVNPKEFRNCNQVVHKFANHYIDLVLSYSPEELEEKGNGYVFLYELAKQVRDPKILRDQSLNILLAGRDTTAGLLSFAIFELARNPQKWAKLRAEILQRFGPTDLEDITFESLKSCEYLKAVLNETLRLYPSVPRNARYATKDTTLPHGGGPDGASPIFIGKGQLVVYNISATQCDPYYYGKDADVYRPERWFEESTRKLGWAYLPFNGGPRICLGQQFALTEASYVLTRMAQTYSSLTLRNGYDYPPRKMTHLTMCLFDGAWVKVEK
ncbi:uncharacterized protein LODBEIA_P16010 [Lodderomyces beijingensis]|uniref:Uncharacterized protein n=1 Tax=Lodderomyces beijingensis TaxID=1775926 RepID=A0ABP0ZGT6_9ASCO